ncbi:MAG: hypothetical protein Q4C91_23010 [Eubacteriales bacterium]|nr:hypothetical protein [Eubacteriales bacterium]
MIKDCLKQKSFEEAKQLLVDYRYALLYMISEVVLTETDMLAEINWEECKEAYFFDSKGQLHIFEEEEEEKFAAIEFLPDKLNFVEHKYSLAAKFGGIGKAVIVREYLDIDEDGQTYVAYTALYDIR